MKLYQVQETIINVPKLKKLMLMFMSLSNQFKDMNSVMSIKLEMSRIFVKLVLMLKIFNLIDANQQLELNHIATNTAAILKLKDSFELYKKTGERLLLTLEDALNQLKLDSNPHNVWHVHVMDVERDVKTLSDKLATVNNETN